MSRLQSLRAASSRDDVADLLGYKPKALAYILYKIPDPVKYKTFQLSKRGGGTREINAPCAELKGLQRKLSELLQDCIDEINAKRKFKDQLAHGFKRRRSIVTNAGKHRNRQFVFNVDLENFFGTINFGRVRGFFIKDANFMLDADVATVLAQIACHKNGLPQGSPCSPVISNLVGHILDVHLCRLATKHGCTYSRYADDITFSTNKPMFPASIGRLMPGQTHKWEVGPELQKIVARAQFTINQQKTRMQYEGSRQDVTGLVVNKKVNIRAEYRRTVRAMAQRLFMTGTFQSTRMVPDANGVVTRTKIDGTVAQLQGMIGHINRVDRYNEEQDAKRVSANHKAKDIKESAKAALRSKERLYRRFLLFKDFYAAQKPVVICEGKTDNIYLEHAIKHLAAYYPTLASITPQNKVGLTVRILKTFESSAGRVLHLAQGWSGLTGLIESYAAELQKFKAPGLTSPVILLVDNDSAANKIFGVITKVTGKVPSKTDAFIHVMGNMYVVLTPLKAGQTESEIEDCFDDTIQQLTLNGKTFTAESNFDPVVYFGKHILSQYVREHAAKIDFTGFRGVLDRIAAAISDYATQNVAAPTGQMAGQP